MNGSCSTVWACREAMAISVPGQMVVDVSEARLTRSQAHNPPSLRTTHYTLHTTHYTLHTTHFTLHTKPCTLHPTPYTLHTTHFTLHLLFFFLITERGTPVGERRDRGTPS